MPAWAEVPPSNSSVLLTPMSMQSGTAEHLHAAHLEAVAGGLPAGAGDAEADGGVRLAARDVASTAGMSGHTPVTGAVSVSADRS